MPMKILCVEDDRIMQTLIAASLQDCSVVMTDRISAAEKELRSQKFDALILDIVLPDGDGLKFWTRMASEAAFASLPVLFLTGQNEIANKLQAFSLGADDFITKPFDPLELRARVSLRVKAKSGGREDETRRRIGDLEIDLNRQTATLMGADKRQELNLTTIEFKLLVLLSKSMNQPFSRQQILGYVWGSAHVSDRTVDSHIAHLRSKIGDSLVEIQTVKNLGYRLGIKNA